jgi:ribosomal protein L37AE/L43A
VDSAKSKFKEAGGCDGLKAKGQEGIKKSKELADKGIGIAKQKFEDAGGVEGIKDKINTFMSEVKAGFTPNEETTGFKRVLSRATNLWRSGRAGKISIIAVCSVAVIIVANLGGGASDEGDESRTSDVAQNAENTLGQSPWGYSETSGASETTNKKPKMKRIGIWVCSQCGERIESITRPSGRCAARINAPHGWVRKGEIKVPDNGQKMTVWQCRKCFKVMIHPGGAPPSGIRCPKEKNSPHGWDKIGTQ